MLEKAGILLLNVGTPSAPAPKAVRQYLQEFLTDKRMITLPTWLRYPLVYGLIAPFRAGKSAKAYQEVWDSQTGSPLLHYSIQCQQALQAENPQIPVALGMRYGQPSIEKAVHELLDLGCERLILFPMFPQYASATTASAVEEVYKVISKRKNIPAITSILDYYDHPDFIAPLASTIKPYLDPSVDRLMLSYHGLPLKQIEQSEAKTLDGCYAGKPCPQVGDNNRYCYRAQCFGTTRALVKALDWPLDATHTVFQSRLGPLPWIEPNFVGKLKDLAGEGVKNLVVACPSFTADCLETLEEIGISGRKTWQELGGKRFDLVPCLNNHPAWTKGICQIAASHLSSGATMQIPLTIDAA